MAEEQNKKSWKSMFINGEENKKSSSEPAVKEKSKVTFPNKTNSDTNTSSVFDHASTSSNTNLNSTTNSNLDETILQKVKESYAQNFIKLNKPGYDFFEYFNAIRKTGTDKPGVFSMALDMASAMDSNITKDLLAAQAADYIKQINNIHSNNLSKGEQKKTEILNSKSTESKNLSVELETLNQQLSAIQNQIEEKKRRLDNIEHKYQPQIQEIEQKMLSNDFVKNQMILELDKVKTGIESI
jgi:hypothetical protein